MRGEASGAPRRGRRTSHMFRVSGFGLRVYGLGRVGRGFRV